MLSRVPGANISACANLVLDSKMQIDKITSEMHSEYDYVMRYELFIIKIAIDL